MATLTIQIADKDRSLFEQLAKRLNAKIIASDEKGVKKPNAVTAKTIKDAHKGVGLGEPIRDIRAFMGAV